MKDKYFGYARKSPDDKEDTKTSINNQIALMKKTATELGVDLVKIFIDENISGGDRDRKEFTNMKNELYSSDVRGVLVKEQERFARDLSFIRDTLKDFYARDKNLYSCMRRKFVSHRDLGDTFHAVIDENYIEEQKMKADILLEQKKELGLPISRPPFGYKYSKNKNFKIVQKDAKIVLGIVLSYLQKRDYRSIIKDFNINKPKYYRIIKNTKSGIYSGIISYERKIKDSSGKIIRVDKISYLGSYEPIVSKQLWEKVNNNP